MFQETQPIIGTRDIRRAIDFSTQRLGFTLAFGDQAQPPNYVGFRRDAVELHMQFQFEHEMGTCRLRFLVADPTSCFRSFASAASSAPRPGFATPRGRRASSTCTTWMATP
jgi:catechol 2,3-dioxygenase-like lactoylglutathione lyase family enzyme